MKLDGAIISIERRSISSCIDMAIVFYREHLKPLTTLTLVFAIPCCAFAYWVSTVTDWGMFFSLLAFAFISPYYSAVLVAGCGRRVFGERLRIRQAFGHVLRRIIFSSVVLIICRAVTLICGLFLLVPAYLVATRYGFFSEILFLENVSSRRYERRLSEFGSSYGTLLIRMMAISLFYFIVVVSIYVLVDITCGIIFGMPIMLGRLATSPHVDVFDTLELMLYDAKVVTVWMACMCLTFPIARLAWFFCYLDTRIRQECWDLELDFRVEAKRLESAL